MLVPYTNLDASSLPVKQLKLTQTKITKLQNLLGINYKGGTCGGVALVTIMALIAGHNARLSFEQRLRLLALNTIEDIAKGIKTAKQTLKTKEFYNMLPEKQEEVLTNIEVEAFCNSICIAQFTSFKYHKWLNLTKAAKTTVKIIGQKQHDVLFETIASCKIKELQGVKCFYQTNEVYNKGEFLIFLNEVTKKHKDLNNIGISISNFSHSIAVSYDASQHLWDVIDPNKLLDIDDFEQILKKEIDTDKLYNRKLLKTQQAVDEIFLALFETGYFCAINFKMFTTNSYYSQYKNKFILFKNLDNRSYIFNNISRQDSRKNCKLYLAICSGEFLTTTSLLNDLICLKLKYEDLINTKMANKCTPLYYAATYGYFEIAKLLLDHKADPNIKYNGFTPLYAAAAFGNTDVVKLLLDHKSDYKVKFYSYNALGISAFKGHIEIVKLLATSVKHRKVDIYFAINKAAINGHWHVVDFLLIKNNLQVYKALINQIKAYYLANYELSVQNQHIINHPGLAKTLSFFFARQRDIIALKYANLPQEEKGILLEKFKKNYIEKNYKYHIKSSNGKNSLIAAVKEACISKQPDKQDAAINYMVSYLSKSKTNSLSKKITRLIKTIG